MAFASASAYDDIQNRKRVLHLVGVAIMSVQKFLGTIETDGVKDERGIK